MKLKYYDNEIRIVGGASIDKKDKIVYLNGVTNIEKITDGKVEFE